MIILVPDIYLYIYSDNDAVFSVCSQCISLSLQLV